MKEKLAAEATGIQAKLVAEAAGIAEKATSMKALDDASRVHEEFRLKLDKEKQIELSMIAAKKDVAASQADILAKAFSNAKFNIVGGDGAFFDRFVKAVSVGQAIDGVVDSSPHVRSLVESATKSNDDAVLALVQKLIADDPSVKGRLAAMKGTTASGE